MSEQHDPAVVRIGTAGWSIPAAEAARFPAEGSALERYSAQFNCAEINSSFHRPHRASTWERWRDSVPETFRFSVKLSKTISHVARLADCAAELDSFAGQALLLGDRLGVVLVQLPPSFAFDADITARFFDLAAARLPVPLACEPRHASWFEPAADNLLERARVARVAADPAGVVAAATPGGWRGLSYWRLHGSPRMYRSPYGERIADYAEAIRAERGEGRACWCIFDNTASSAATADALALQSALS